jgi:hypothetical protein
LFSDVSTEILHAGLVLITISVFPILYISSSFSSDVWRTNHEASYFHSKNEQWASTTCSKEVCFVV